MQGFMEVSIYVDLPNFPDMLEVIKLAIFEFLLETIWILIKIMWESQNAAFFPEM